MSADLNFGGSKAAGPSGKEFAGKLLVYAANPITGDIDIGRIDVQQPFQAVRDIDRQPLRQRGIGQDALRGVQLARGV
ncbi:MAG: hypothetical protein Q7U85_04495 [Rhodocyclaceae bacterium]|nr:hypothetical protein [Rhodocyclaceae bacterium]